MTFFNLAYRNVTKKFRDYTAYFVSTSFAVMAFYMFNSLFYNRQLMEVSEMLGKVKELFLVTGILVAIFSLVFIWYSNSFFIKSRKKEIATYALLGMEKRRIGRMLFFETVIMGVLAMITGIALGTLFSKFTTMILVSMMNEMVTVRFAVIPEAMKLTIKVFAIIFLVTSIHSYRLIYKFKLIELFQAEKEGEMVPKASLVGALLALILIGTGYAIALYSGMAIVVFGGFMLVTAMVVVGTYFLFNNLIPLVVNLVKRNKGYYYRGTNMLSVSQIFYRIKGNVRVLTTIVTLSAVTITAMATTYAVYKTVEYMVRENAPFTYLYLNTDERINERVRALIRSESEFKLLAEEDLVVIKASAKGGAMRLPSEIYVMPEGKYNEVVKALNYGTPVDLHSNNDVLYQAMAMGEDNDKFPYLNQNIQVKASGVARKFHIARVTTLRIVNLTWARQMVVVKDAVYQNMLAERGRQVGAAYQAGKADADLLKLKGFVLSNQKHTQGLTAKIKKVMPKENHLSTYSDRFEDNYKVAGMLLFSGLFLGILFILATGSIIYFKLLMEAYEDKNRFRIMRNIGLGKDELRKAVRKYILIVFSVPFVLAVSHSLAAIGIVNRVLRYRVYQHFWFVVAVYGVIYALYYLVTMRSYMGVVEKVRG